MTEQIPSESWPDWLRRAESSLQTAGVDDAAGKLRYVAGTLLGCGPGVVETVARQALPTSAEVAARREEMLAELLSGAPAQYVAGEADFCDFTVKTDKRALIPRPETEEWTDALIRHLTGKPQIAPSYRAVEPWTGVPDAPLRLHDVCTGSGCVAIALARGVARAQVTASDIDADALALARENARRLGAPVAFAQADLLAGLADSSLDVLTANPPYISEAAYAGLAPTVRAFEPRRALVGGPNGMELISRLAHEAPRVLRNGAELWMEIGDDQGPATETVLCQAHSYSKIQILCDFAGRARLARALRR